MIDLIQIIDELASGNYTNIDDIDYIIIEENAEVDSYLFKKADEIRRKIYGNKVYIRGLIEIGNYCKNNCYYCGIRAKNKNISRYRMTKDEILECCKKGYVMGFRTFVLQSGEDDFFTDDMICDIVSSIKEKFPDCAVTLSIGEKSRESYLRYYNSGAERYLLRQESATEAHYNLLHPTGMTLKNRIRCLNDLKEIGYQVGAGMMVGTPNQTIHCLVNDVKFMLELQPDMIGIGPFISHSQTPFWSEGVGSLRHTLLMVALCRIIFPNALIPSTTALTIIDQNGCELGLKAGANVVMPNLTPEKYRVLYQLYNKKVCTEKQSADCLDLLKETVKSAGYEVVVDKGDRIGF
ncbi:MAG: [FeFe] hydrogenase H-cluster radical SAM maturase HydE [Oscillospiraceae bacterium]